LFGTISLLSWRAAVLRAPALVASQLRRH
jgi:hypothetical protein